MVRPLAPEEERRAVTLRRVGLGEGEARCLVALLREGWWTRAEAAEATGLSPQDVSTAMRALAQRGAAQLEPERTAARGRPLLRYRLAGAPDEVVARLVAARRAELVEELSALDRLTGA